MMPIDVVSQGTWVGVNDAGLIATLLNVKAPDADVSPEGRVSRGGIVPEMMRHADVEAAVEALKKIEADRVMPFRLLLADGQRVARMRSNGRGLSVELDDHSGLPLMLTSSGLGDHLVDLPRRALFDADPPADTAAQDHFHRHGWADRTPLSVTMCREDARTVSRTVIDMAPEGLVMSYVEVDRYGIEGPPSRQELPRLVGVSD